MKKRYRLITFCIMIFIVFNIATPPKKVKANPAALLLVPGAKELLFMVGGYILKGAITAGAGYIVYKGTGKIARNYYERKAEQLEAEMTDAQKIALNNIAAEWQEQGEGYALDINKLPIGAVGTFGYMMKDVLDTSKTLPFTGPDSDTVVKYILDIQAQKHIDVRTWLVQNYPNVSFEINMGPYQRMNNLYTIDEYTEFSSYEGYIGLYTNVSLFIKNKITNKEYSTSWKQVTTLGTTAGIQDKTKPRFHISSYNYGNRIDNYLMKVHGATRLKYLGSWLYYGPPNAEIAKVLEIDTIDSLILPVLTRLGELGATGSICYYPPFIRQDLKSVDIPQSIVMPAPGTLLNQDAIPLPADIPQAPTKSLEIERDYTKDAPIDNPTDPTTPIDNSGFWSKLWDYLQSLLQGLLNLPGEIAKALGDVFGYLKTFPQELVAGMDRIAKEFQDFIRGIQDLANPQIDVDALQGVKDRVKITRFQQSWNRIANMNTARGEPPKININLSQIFVASTSRFGSPSSPFADQETTFIDFGKWNEMRFMGKGVVDYFRDIMGFGMVITTLFYVWKKLTSNETIGG